MNDVLLFTGGSGGAKLSAGLQNVLPNSNLHIIVNTADDFNYLGLNISPDIDSVIYSLAGCIDQNKGWGVKEEDWSTYKELKKFDFDNWFSLGNKDIATHLFRNELLFRGFSLEQVSKFMCESFRVGANVIPMTNDKVSTHVYTQDGLLAFQEYFVKYRCVPIVKEIIFKGIEKARVSESFGKLLKRGSRIIIGPSNPYLSIDPILSLPGVREAIRENDIPTILISPIVQGDSIKGPLTKIMTEMKLDCSVYEIAKYYSDIIRGVVIHESDFEEEEKLKELNMPCFSTNIIMKNDADKVALASNVLNYLELLSNRC